MYVLALVLSLFEVGVGNKSFPVFDVSPKYVGWLLRIFLPKNVSLMRILSKLRSARDFRGELRGVSEIGPPAEGKRSPRGLFRVLGRAFGVAKQNDLILMV
ncbi:hypothetical protein AKJ52_00690 [candidate division MSBL1 archaeon SCGC-AAA382C18]|uniref:Uncharacterized protein n=1 Tax=candidate division MSBL1 archaeon SCGC-AAA382C18 TaxID=1698281 RepID=A0A133VLD3_9EURY|nr:hypothetical protein AKJ52_00690 [candidate division MSBL1 archaeon SCGC-AAA382C18]